MLNQIVPFHPTVPSITIPKADISVKTPNNIGAGIKAPANDDTARVSILVSRRRRHARLAGRH